MADLKKLYQDDWLVFAGDSLVSQEGRAFEQLVDLLYSKEWIPHIEETFKGAANVIEYSGRYTNRFPLSTHGFYPLMSRRLRFIPTTTKIAGLILK